MTCDHPVPPDRYDERVEEHLRSTGFYHVSQIGVVQCQKALVNALVERWHPDTHTFHLPVGECAVSLEDVAMIFGLPTEGLPVTGKTLSSFEALEAECLHQFGVAPRKSDCRGSGIKLTWLRDLKERSQLTDENSIQVYVKCHIMLLIGTILFGDKSGTSVHWKYLPLLRNRWSADTSTVLGMDALPYLAPVPREPRSGETGSVEIESIDIISLLIFGRPWMNSKKARFRRQFSFIQEVPHQERSLDRAHGEVLTGPKNLNWATATTHSFWDVEGDQVMDDDNEEQEPQSPPPPTPPPPPPPAAEEQPHSTSQYVPQIQFPTSFPIHQPYFDSGEGGSFSQLLGFMASDAGQAQYSHQADFMAGRYSFDARYPFYTYSGATGGFVSGDSSRSDGGRGVLNSQNPNRVSMTMIEENAKTFEHETAEYLVDEPDDEEDDEDEDEDMEEEDDEDMDQDEESRNDRGDTCTPGETGKGYNLKIDPPRHSASRYTPSVIKKAAKKCKNIVNFGKWTVRK
ncbi:uncharacterized protein DS421_11g322650 [Arachis hypogaea]|nr:uncharacterized protein DS421_11g322650 [Arachis hypogaea]